MKFSFNLGNSKTRKSQGKTFKYNCFNRNDCKSCTVPNFVHHPFATPNSMPPLIYVSTHSACIAQWKTYSMTLFLVNDEIFKKPPANTAETLGPAKYRVFPEVSKFL